MYDLGRVSLKKENKKMGLDYFMICIDFFCGDIIFPIKQYIYSHWTLFKIIYFFFPGRGG